MLLACSFGHNENALPVPEEQYFVYPGISGHDNPPVRADIAGFTTRNGGAVFSTSSMAWCGSLSHNSHENSTARMTEHVPPFRNTGRCRRAERGLVNRPGRPVT
ncbi:MAG: hypothetical protein ACU85U_00035 [Gammaproteobacteria bacterium]|jgi:N,N-dimethylformamidase